VKRTTTPTQKKPTSLTQKIIVTQCKKKNTNARRPTSLMQEGQQHNTKTTTPPM
jgi:hypothetical protein